MAAASLSRSNGSSPRLRGTELTIHCSGLPCRFIPAPAGNGQSTMGDVGTPSVHPRACGERPVENKGSTIPCGSSPRLRGTGRIAGVADDSGRFIPAPAGNGSISRVIHSIPSVHPRACGERGCFYHSICLFCGSSPRLRGTVLRAADNFTAHRFIPAPAGNGDVAVTHLITVTVHPRACGERPRCIRWVGVVIGSSPRLRGTAPDTLSLGCRFWFIPAPAGNGSTQTLCHSVLPVHPRACGERPNGRGHILGPGGSSPRLRGTVCRLHPLRAEYRFIPAPAGNGSSRFVTTASVAVHPRACGERTLHLEEIGEGAGSSPRLRGTDHGLQPRQGCGRFIPAPAGNGMTPGPSTTRATVHPRACGERALDLSDSCGQVGSSPRLRGTGPRCIL